MTTRLAPRRRLGAAALALLALLAAILMPAAALAHPLGNFTINHFAALRVAPDHVALDVVIDRAEIPAFQEQQRLDLDGDGVLAPAELERERVAACLALAPDLRLALEGAQLTPSLVAAGLTTPPGAGGLPTMRLVCEYRAPFGAPITAPANLTFEDGSFAERIGWREIVALGDGVATDAGPGANSGPGSGSGSDTAPAATGLGVSNRLTTYPTDLLAQPLDQRAVSVAVTPGGTDLPDWSAPDAVAIAAPAVIAPPPSEGGPGSASVLPGGIAEDLAGLIDIDDVTPLAILASLAIAFGLGIVHALSPGHGKTIMAAYLVGGRGSSRQAIGLGLAVAVSHTLGVLALAAITLAASSVFPPERLYPILGVASGTLVVAIGTSLLWSRLKEVRERRRRAAAHAAAHDHAPAHAHAHDPEDDARGHGHEHDHDHGHSHAPDGASISWRGLVALGLSGGLVPSASALILLLGSIAAGRVAYGLVLVVGFGIGMAFVLAGIGLLLVHARQLVARRPSLGRLGRLTMPVQLATASLVVVLGVVLTGQALTQVL